MKQETEIFELTNGLRCVHRKADGKVSYIGVVTGAGSRDEPETAQGLAHFVEHTIFKGTRRRKSWHVSNRMESVGGELNAYTSKEETLVFTNAPAGYTDRALDLLGDIVANSCFPEYEINLERGVIIEEIKSYLDSPSESVYDEFDEKIYAGSPMAHNILGSPESVERITGEDCRSFLDRCYTPSDMVLYIVNDTDARRAEKMAEKHFGGLHFSNGRPSRETPRVNERFSEEHHRDGHQAHTLLGARVCDRSDSRRFPLFLLNNYLGGPCMNSRLNQELRERRGYVYTVDSTLALMSDCGLFQVYFGSDLSKVEKCKKLIIRELEKLADKRMSDAAFERSRRQYIGMLDVSTDRRESMAMALGKSLLYYGRLHDTSWTRERLMEVKAEQVREAAESILKAGLSELTLC